MPADFENVRRNLRTANDEGSKALMMFSTFMTGRVWESGDVDLPLREGRKDALMTSLMEAITRVRDAAEAVIAELARE